MQDIFSDSPLLAALLGGLIAGLATLIAVSKSYQNQMEFNKIKEDKELYNFQCALHDELIAYHELYLQDIGEIIKMYKEGPLKTFLPQVVPFTMYGQCASFLGRIDDEEYRSLIVQTYSKAEIFSDLIKWHNITAEKYGNFYWESVALNNEKLSKRKFEATAKSLKATSDNVCSLHAELYNDAEKLIKIFKEKLRQ